MLVGRIRVAKGIEMMTGAAKVMHAVFVNGNRQWRQRKFKQKRHS